jgi:hypothetical protein
MSKSLQRTFHRCFLPSVSSFGRGVSEEKIKMWKVNGRQTPSDGKKLTLPLTRWGKNCWLLFLLSWVLFASLITHKRDSLNSIIKLLSNITWNHNIYMGAQVHQELPTLLEHLCSVSWNIIFFCPFCFWPLRCLSFSMKVASDYLCLLYLQTFLIPRTGTVMVVIIW